MPGTGQHRSAGIHSTFQPGRRALDDVPWMAPRREPQRLRQPPRAPPGACRWRRGESPSDSDSRRTPRPAPVDVAAAGAARAPATPTAASLPTRRRSMAPLPARRGFQELLQPPRSPCGAGRCRRGEGPSDSNSRRAPRPAPVDGAAARAPATQTAIWPASPGACPPEARTPCQRLAGRELENSSSPANAAF